MVQVCSRNQEKLNKVAAKNTAKKPAAAGWATGSTISPHLKASVPVKIAVAVLAKAPESRIHATQVANRRAPPEPSRA